MSDSPPFRCYYVATTIVHTVVADCPRAAAAIALDELEATSPYRADRVRVTLALAPPPDRGALDAVPSWESAEAPAAGPVVDPRRAWTLRRWLRAQRRARRRTATAP